MEDSTVSLRVFLTIKTMEQTRCDWHHAATAVGRVIVSNPKWDLSERRTFPEWEAELNRQWVTT